MATTPKTTKPAKPKATTTKPKVDWRAQFKIEYPQFGPMLDGADGEARARATLGDDLIDLFIDFANNPNKYDLTTDAGRAVWISKVQGTKLYTSTDKSKRAWALLGQADKDDQVQDKIPELRNKFSDLELDDTQLRDLATYSLSTGASELQTQYYAYSIISNRQAAKGAPPTIGETDLATTLKNSLRLYNYNPPGIDEQIRSALTGQPYLGTVYTQDMLIKKAKDTAKIMYSQFSNQFDQGYTLEDVFEPYRNLAAEVLEKNPSDIRMDDPKFKVALNKNPDGTSMSPEEFTYVLRSDPRYEWTKTRAAKNQAMNLINMLEKNWGLVQ
jgi:hypothetical protein